MTKEEKHLWFDFLACYPIPFVRQKRIGFFAVDFYCRRCRPAIELDGSQHYSEKGTQEDGERTKVLAQEGISVLRFPNSQIHKNFKGVCKMIDREVQKRLLQNHK